MRWVLAPVLVLAACGDNLKPPPPDVLKALKALPNVADATEMPTQTVGYHYIVLHFVQPVDHNDPASATFLQEVSLLHKDTAQPLIVHTSGYSDYYKDKLVELTNLLGANQISIEHRYFGTSRPAPADWSKLTIEQMADDEHEIVAALRTVYTGAAISSGGSKGGMTAVFFRRFFPDDVDGSVPYVAPISFAEPDTRYPAFIATLGPTACHQAVQAVAIELLANRRAAIEARASAQAATNNYTYTRILLGPAVETAIEGLEWSFWQYFGVDYCANVPAVTATDDQLFSFLDSISPVSDSDDDQVAFFEAYYYQSYAQLAYPDDGTTYLKPYYKYTDADFVGALPDGVVPPYDGGAAMHDIDNYVQIAGNRLVFVYGQWDPWTGGKFSLGAATDSLELEQAQGTHGSKITHLADADQQAVFDKLLAWTGVTPGTMPRVEPEQRIPHVSRALHMRRAPP
jgi:hypothetical protein